MIKGKKGFFSSVLGKIIWCWLNFEHGLGVEKFYDVDHKKVSTLSN